MRHTEDAVIVSLCTKDLLQVRRHAVDVIAMRSDGQNAAREGTLRHEHGTWCQCVVTVLPCQIELIVVPWHYRLESVAKQNLVNYAHTSFSQFYGPSERVAEVI